MLRHGQHQLMLGGTKDMLLPAVDVAANFTLQVDGSAPLKQHDYIIDVDNKSINSRPDLWGHRGIAREIAAILDLPLRPLDEFIAQKDVVAYESSAKADVRYAFFHCY